MSIKQVRTKNNTYSTVKYDSEGKILTPSRLRELKKLKKVSKKLPKKSPKKKTKSSKWIRLESQFDGFCCVCQNKINIGAEILWNRINKKTRHRECAFPKSFKA
jgi:hypothetical protein